MNYPSKSELKIGDFVQIEIYERGKTKNESGKISEFLTNVEKHPRGIKVRLDNSAEGRVTEKINEQRLQTLSKNGNATKAYESWSDEDDRKLKNEIMHLTPRFKIAKNFNRTENAIQARVLHFIDPNHSKYDYKFAEKLENIVKDSGFSKVQINTKEEEPTIEFKETFSFDTKEQKFRKQGKIAEADGRKKQEKQIRNAIQKEVSIACSAFANTNSGILEIGKTDDGEISEYFESDKNRYENWDEYTRAVITSIKEFTNDSVFSLSIEILNSSDQKDTLKLQIPKSKHPIFINDNGKEEFYVRSNAAAKSEKITKIAEQMRYCEEHFPNWKP